MEIGVTLTIEEWNKVLASLGALPFAEVVDLITKIKMQAEGVIAAKNMPAPVIAGGGPASPASYDGWTANYMPAEAA